MNVRDSPSKNWGFSITAFLLTSRGYSNASSWLRLLANLCQSCWLVHVFDGDASETSPFWVVCRICAVGMSWILGWGLIPEDDVTRHSISPLFIRGLGKRRRSDGEATVFPDPRVTWRCDAKLWWLRICCIWNLPLILINSDDIHNSII